MKKTCPVCDSFGCCDRRLNHTYDEGCILNRNKENEMRDTVRKLKTEMVVLVVGDLKRGFSHYGPFKDEDDARLWAKAQLNGAFDYQLVKLYNPLKGSGRENGAAALAGV